MNSFERSVFSCLVFPSAEIVIGGLRPQEVVPFCFGTGFLAL